MAKATVPNYLLLTYLLIHLLLPSYLSETITLYKPEDILDAARSQCLVLFPHENLTKWKKDILQLLADVSFGNESSVLFGTVNTDNFLWPNGRQLNLEGSKTMENYFLIFKRIELDRTCLLLPETNIPIPSVATYNLTSFVSPDVLDDIVQFINTNCHTFRNKEGQLTVAGIHRQHILENLFKVPKTKENKNLDHKQEDESCMIGENDYAKKCENRDEHITNAKTQNKYVDTKNELQKCDRIQLSELSSPLQFFQEFVSVSKPVIITGAIKQWPAFTKWTRAFLHDRYGDIKIHIKMTSDGIYEGVEPKSIWRDESEKEIPKAVLEKLPYPDLVVVRPASREILFSDFLDLVENISQGKVKDISAYLEYSSIADYFPELQEDITEMEFFRNILELKHLNLWLSDGNTLGKLHFDPFDNFLCQISGVKELLLYEPHDNSKLYEAHIQEAVLSYNQSSHTFHRKTLLESTSMVMSPVDISDPDLKRFPKFADLQPLNCTIQAGEVLYMPAFWWHEVQSKPNVSEHRNMAVNFWYEPFLTREFPCPECSLDVNPKYFHLL
ncbi:jmjC domain-containing protein E [Biomphalaria glabrata]|nr:jmjC domain-containing protein E [Biomphalaria glabrata]